MCYAPNGARWRISELYRPKRRLTDVITIPNIVPYGAYSSRSWRQGSEEDVSMHREDIKAAIRKSGTTLVALALNNGLKESTVRKALQRPSLLAEGIIARQLDKRPQDIWPDRYDELGLPKRSRRGQSGRALPRPAKQGGKHQKRGEV